MTKYIHTLFGHWNVKRGPCLELWRVGSAFCSGDIWKGVHNCLGRCPKRPSLGSCEGKSSSDLLQMWTRPHFEVALLLNRIRVGRSMIGVLEAVGSYTEILSGFMVLPLICTSALSFGGSKPSFHILWGSWRQMQTPHLGETRAWCFQHFAQTLTKKQWHSPYFSSLPWYSYWYFLQPSAYLVVSWCRVLSGISSCESQRRSRPYALCE